MHMYKYVLAPIPGTEEITAPVGAEFLSCGAQDDQLVVWARVDPDAELFKFLFHLSWTGWECPLSRFLGSVQTKDSLVWHIFVEI